MNPWDIEASLRWRSADAEHCEWRHFAGFRTGHDILPGDFAARIAKLGPEEAASVTVAPGDGWIAIDPALRIRVRRDQFRHVEARGLVVEPRVGRFYPRGLLVGIPDLASADRRPFRVLDCDVQTLEVDLNHPLAGLEMELSIRLLQTGAPAAETASRDLLALLADDGPGMQAALPGRATDFYSDRPFSRGDESDDALFYATARPVSHLDATALQRLTSLYAPLIEPGMAVLDLMASWDSHLPDAVGGLDVVGLGLNAAELDSNPRLSKRVVHNLNCEPRLPFGDAQFDVVLCSLSVEYLTRPAEVLREAARVLRPGTACALALSERWFPPKAIRVWSELHPFERIGLALDIFRRSGRFRGLATASLRGLPRPPGDKYAGITPWSDPLYLVRGQKA
jgi:SAM-dependent methyltransferase